MIRRLIILLLIVGCVFAQQYEDVVILKDGSEIHGIIIEQKPNEYIKIKSGKNIFVYQMDEIDLFKKELKIKDDDIFNKNNSIGIGFGTNKTFNAIQYTYDLKISRNFAIFGLLGYGNLIGSGVTWQSNYNQNGAMIGYSGGIDVDDYIFGNLSLSYQWRLKNNPNFISLGICSFGYVDQAYKSYDEIKENMNLMFVPIISIDRRF